MLRRCDDTVIYKRKHKLALKGREDEEEDVSCYWIVLRRREYTVNCKRKH
jgi:hypothetical protein